MVNPSGAESVAYFAEPLCAPLVGVGRFSCAVGMPRFLWDPKLVSFLWSRLRKLFRRL